MQPLEVHSMQCPFHNAFVNISPGYKPILRPNNLSLLYENVVLQKVFLKAVEHQQHTNDNGKMPFKYLSIP